MRFADIWLVIGTRPEAIKLSPVVRALRESGVDPVLIVTGQHPSLDLAEFGLGDFPSRALGCPGRANPYDHSGRVEEHMRAELRSGPDLLVVQGDTSSAHGAARAAFVHGIPVAHVEAGLRTHDTRSPWPEEEFRSAIDSRAELLFAPTALNAANLAAERIAGQVHVTGNSGIDALLETVASLPPVPLAERHRPRILVTCHRRESWGAGLVEIAEGISGIATAREVAVEVILHPNPDVAKLLRRRLAGRPGIALLEPQSHDAIVERMRECDLILSDSGGIQEEAPALGVPLLVLREKTERPEAIASGNARMAGVKSGRIVAEALRLLDHPAELAAMARPAFPFGNGHSATRMVRIIGDWLAHRSSGSGTRARS